ncbi:NUDIX hydrolase [Sutcliffiella rhizosphaerae]|uniref:Nudix hydrolase domain-containing protein n=1 Tax=Sutcliffiella rhizosphaerae TaxID=2880967 RepID=A0ABN8ADW8_9BACI|nr:NUDIX domain-containing protein [Sutcliffiella rhizosphaerae]CAG9622466.1 hypothetical protein BACCIP111883_03257 [Sutcliffiella rhizosphaerae]
MDYVQHIRSMVGKEKIIMVVAGAVVFDNDHRVLLQQRSDTLTWGIPGGFMELNENIQDTARREVHEETGLKMRKLELFGVYSGPEYDKTFPNGDQVSLVQFFFTCNDYEGNLLINNESISMEFFSLSELPSNLFSDHQMLFRDLLSNRGKPIIS